jgi:hypothetical protein
MSLRRTVALRPDALARCVSKCRFKLNGMSNFAAGVVGAENVAAQPSIVIRTTALALARKTEDEGQAVGRTHRTIILFSSRLGSSLGAGPASDHRRPRNRRLAGRDR